MIMTAERGRPKLYPWTKWMYKALRDPPLRIVQGRDFTCDLKSMDVQIRLYAGRKNLAASIKTESGGVLKVTYKRRKRRATNSR